MNEHRFNAMGCEIIVGGATPTEQVAVRRLFAERERIFSRFVPSSELNRVNGCAGRPVRVSPIFAETLRLALHAAEDTEGMVRPTFGAALEGAGYTRDSASLRPDPAPPSTAPAQPTSPVLALGRIVVLAVGVKLDLNGVVKSLAVDDAMGLLARDGFISAGGDLAARGDLAVELPGGAVVSLRRGGLATSGSTKRRWLRGGRLQHHLIDPRTGRPSTSRWSQVTACGASCLAADVAAKAGFLLGDRGPKWLDQQGIPARFCDEGGEVILNDAWSVSMRGAAACT